MDGHSLLLLFTCLLTLITIKTELNNFFQSLSINLIRMYTRVKRLALKEILIIITITWCFSGFQLSSNWNCLIITGCSACSVSFSSPGGTNIKFSFSTSWNAKNVTATIKIMIKNWTIITLQKHLLFAKNYILWMRENSVDSLALGAFNIHKERIRALDFSFKFVSVYLISWVYVKKVDFHCFC